MEGESIIAQRRVLVSPLLVQGLHYLSIFGLYFNENKTRRQNCPTLIVRRLEFTFQLIIDGLRTENSAG